MSSLATYSRLRALQLATRRDVRESAYALNRARDIRLAGQARSVAYADRLDWAATYRGYVALPER